MWLPILLCALRVDRCAEAFSLLLRSQQSRKHALSSRLANDATTNKEGPTELPEPSPDRTFGRQQYWEDAYRNAGGDSFSWYSGWEDLAPFVRELIPDMSSHVLIPGIGNDAAIVDMYDAGYNNMTAFDYAPEGINCARRLLGGRDVELLVSDARNLPLPNDTYDAVLDKGTLDAIYLSGGIDKTLSATHLEMAVSELARVLRSGGTVISVSAACAEAVESTFNKAPKLWAQVRDGSTYLTEDGYASNSVDGSLFAWRRR